MTEIIPNLYLGSIRNANSKVKHYDIIINLSCERLKPHVLRKSTVYNFDIEDEKDSPIYLLFGKTYSLIDSNLRKGNSVLVNCFMGISRSATIVIHYLMTKYNINLRKAKEFVESKRPIINPNPGFLKMLKF